LPLSSPALVLSIIIASAYGALFHVWKGKTAQDLLIYLAVGLVGFGLGQLAGNTLSLGIFMIGQIHVVEASLIWERRGVVNEQPKSEIKSPEAKTPMDPRAQKMIVIVLITVVAIVALLGIAGFLLYRSGVTEFLRDIAIIVLAFETLVVIFLLGVMTVLLIYVVLTMEREIKPALDAISETVHTVRGTTTFVSDTVVSPIMTVASTVGAVKGAAQAITGLRPKGRGKRGSD
jgi:hypothetical protein